MTSITTPCGEACPVCHEPESLCCCDGSPATKLALSIVQQADDTARATVKVKLADLLILCERAHAWGQHQSKAVLSEMKRTIWMVTSRTSAMPFASLEAAQAYRGGFPASIGGGMEITEMAVHG